MDKKKYEVKVIPNSKMEQVFEDNGILKIKIRSRAEKGEANKVLVQLLEKYFKGKVKILSGFTSRNKVISVERS